jgi:hypothetical protein
MSDNNMVRETTIFYGVLIRIGGYARPRAYIQFLDGQKLSCSIANRPLAISMAARLYQSIGVRGTATYDEQDKTLASFHIEELLPYRDAADAFKGLVEIVGNYYDRLEDYDDGGEFGDEQG